MEHYRYSQRQVTKRKFNIGSLLNGKQAASVISTKISPIAAFALPTPPKAVDNGTSDRELAESIRSSPLAAIIEHPDDNFTPVQEQESNGESRFLSSTPKPGKSSTNRRRPVFSAIKPATRHNSSQSLENDSSRIPRTSVKQTKSTDTSKQTKSTDTSIRKQNSVSERSRFHPSVKAVGSSVTKTSTKTGVSTKLVSDASTTQSYNHSDASDHVKSVAKKANKRSRVTQVSAESSIEDTIVVQSQPTKQISFNAKRQKVGGSSASDHRGKKSTSHKDTQQIKQGKRLLNQRQNSVESMEEQLNESSENDNNIAVGDVTMILWETAGIKRKKADFTDVDVILNSFTELLEGALDVCDSQPERGAVRILEKYLVQDMTAMIDTNQKVRNLQNDVRKNTQSLTQKQKNLMELQKKRLKLEENAAKNEENSRSNQNRAAINRFLNDMKLLISKC